MNSRIIHRQMERAMPVARKGDGVYVVDEQGRYFLDACGGAAVSCLGHSHPKVIQAIREQADVLAYAHTGFFSTEPAESLAEFLVANSPSGLDHALFVSGGSEATEAALKLAKQYHYDNGEPRRNLFIAREQSFHGNTLGALSVGGNIWRRKPFEGALIDTHHIQACNPYRNTLEGESEESYGIRAANLLEQNILEVGPENVAAFVAETVGGATAGVLVPPKGYFKRIREICDRYGVLLILDEVMCGMGRTGSLFAFEQESIQPDIVTMAKGLAGGYQPIGAVMCSSKIYECIDQGYGYFQHSHTYMGHAIACAAAMAVQQTIQEESLLINVAAMGNLLHNGLQSAFGDHPNVGDIRGRGMFRAIELVADRDSKLPFQASSSLHQKIKHRAMEVGLMCYPGAGTADGVNGHHVLLAPPFIAQRYHIEELLDKLNYAVTTALLDVEKGHE